MIRKKTVALVGRPNVGKSTLFNRLSTRKKAIVHDKPGVTRDRKYSEARIGEFEFLLIDTPGLEETDDAEKLEHRMMQQTMHAIIEADLICLIVDGLVGILPIDKIFAQIIRTHKKNVVLVVNKCEKRFDAEPEYYRLGFGEPIAISAEHGLGMMELYEAFTTNLPEEEEQHKITDPISAKCMQVVVAGRPNAGKSTFINAILGYERLLTGKEAGITRESIEIDINYDGKPIKLIDTAGLRKRANIEQSLEKLSASDAIHSINYANTVILMLDATHPLEQQDLNIASYVTEQGRSLVIAVNKWDLIEDKAEFKKQFEYILETKLGQIKGVATVFMSALNRSNVDAVLDAALQTYDIWNKKITTSKLNQWLSFVTEDHPLPLQKGGRRLRIKYMTQIKTRPPTFKLFSNNPDKIPDAYIKYLTNNLRETFGLPGVPIRFFFTKTENPYV